MTARSPNLDLLRGAAMTAMLALFAPRRGPWTFGELRQAVEGRRVATRDGAFMMNTGRVRRALHWLIQWRDLRQTARGYWLTRSGARSIASARWSDRIRRSEAAWQRARRRTDADVWREIEREAERIWRGGKRGDAPPARAER